MALRTSMSKVPCTRSPDLSFRSAIRIFFPINHLWEYAISRGCDARPNFPSCDEPQKIDAERHKKSARQESRHASKLWISKGFEFHEQSFPGMNPAGLHPK